MVKFQCLAVGLMRSRAEAVVLSLASRRAQEEAHGNDERHRIIKRTHICPCPPRTGMRKTHLMSAPPPSAARLPSVPDAQCEHVYFALAIASAPQFSRIVQHAFWRLTSSSFRRKLSLS